jgi:hypothetical protein
LGSKIKGVNRVGINVEDIGSGKALVFIQGRPVNLACLSINSQSYPKLRLCVVLT